MRLHEEFNKSGSFWWPQNPQQKMLGTLSIKDGGNIELELTAIPLSALALNENSKERLVGTVRGGGLHIRLENCWVANRGRMIAPGIWRPLIRAESAFVGPDDAIFSCDPTIFFSHDFSFSVDRLNDWVKTNGPETASDDFSCTPEIDGIKIRFRQPDPIQLNLENGIQLDLVWFYTKQQKPSNNSIPPSSVEISQHAQFKAHCDEEKSLDEIYEIIQRITYLLCFAMHTSFNSLEWQATVETTDGITIYHRPKHSIKSYRTKPFQWLFPFVQIRERVDDVFKSWLDGYARAGMVFDTYFGLNMDFVSYSVKPTSFVMSFLGWVWALEMYYKLMTTPTSKERNSKRNPPTPAGAPHFREIFNDLFSPFAHYFGGCCNVEKIVNDMKKYRNEFSHPGEEFDSYSNDPAVLDLCHVLRFLLELHILDMLGFSNSEIEEALRGHAYWQTRYGTVRI